MTATEPDAPVPKKAGKLPLIAGFILAILGAAGGFFATTSGVLPFAGGAADAETPVAGDSAGADGEATGKGASDDVARSADATGFVPIDPLVVNVPTAEGRSFLRFTAQIEVNAGQEAAVTAVMPRIVDVLNGYLRAVEPSELEDPAILHKLRGQMLRRIQIVTGADVARDLLIMEFVMN